jgi:predicted membrane channel-forming protein YqfA (hemolysin III family)
MLPFLTIIAGIWLGMRFSIFALIPASAVLVSLFYVTSPTADAGPFAIQLFILLCCSQVGYMTGLAAREPCSRLSLWFTVRRTKQV